jgi:uncharacterized membrane protein
MDVMNRIRVGVAASLALLLALRGLRKGSLDRSGAIAAFIVGFLTFCAGTHFGLALIAFYLSSSTLTKFKAKEKQRIDAEYKEGGQRNYVQVLCNSGFATVLAATHVYFYDALIRPFGSRVNSTGIPYLSSDFLHFAFLG